MELLNGVREIITEIMDVDGETITEGTSLIGDLGAESIDLLELAVSMSHRFGLPVQDDEIFLRKFPLYRLEAAQAGADPLTYLAERIPFLPPARIAAILAARDRASALTIGDLIRYLRYQRGERT
ncbi:MAG: acyl carrier protein [Syntrophales bacterium]